MLALRKYLLVSLSAVFICAIFFIALNSILNPHIPATVEKYIEKKNALTPEVLDAIYELENTPLNIFEKPNDYSTRFYRISAETPRILEVHYYEPESKARFLRSFDDTTTYPEFRSIADFRSIAEFLYKYPDQKILVPLSSLEGNYFLENAYFYRPDGVVADLRWQCHGERTRRCYPISVYYNLDEKKITGGTRIVKRETRIDRPPTIKSPPYPKTKP